MWVHGRLVVGVSVYGDERQKRFSDDAVGTELHTYKVYVCLALVQLAVVVPHARARRSDAVKCTGRVDFNIMKSPNSHGGAGGALPNTDAITQ